MSTRTVGRRLPVVLVLAVFLSLLVAPAARACSCFDADPRDALEGADGAFIGTLMGMTPLQDDPAFAEYTFDVETTVKGDIGATIELRAGSTDASCAFEAQVGDRIGAFTYRQDGRWWSGLCNQIHPERLLAAATPLPEPDGTGPARFVVAVNIGHHRLMSLDAKGRTLAYGAGDGYAIDVDLCPGARRMIEAARIDRTGSLHVRELPSLDVVRRIDVVSGPPVPRLAAACLNRSGSRLIAVERHAGEHWIHELRGANDRIVWHGAARSVTLDGTRALILDRRSLSILTLASGSPRFLATVPAGAQALGVSPDRTRVAGLLSDPDGEASIFAVSLSDGSVDRYVLEAVQDVAGDLAWLDERRLVFLPRDGTRGYVLHAGTMEPVVGFDGWDAGASVVSGGTAYGTSWGYLIAVRLSTGDVRVIRLLDSPETGVLDVVLRPAG